MSSSSSPVSSNPVTAPVVAAINHVLAQEAWARDVLVLHAGKVALLDAGSIALRVQVTRDGMLDVAGPNQSASVTIRVRLADLPLIAQNRARAFSYVKIEGDAEFANTISQLSKVLRWDAEHDLERWTGPIVAARIVGGARSMVETGKVVQRKLSENLAEYLLDEQPVLVRPAMLETLSGDVIRLRDDVERAAKRLAKLEKTLAPHGAGPAPSTRDGGQSPLDS
ncbi:MAG: SCP2 sterol-binding domain-containing protein [Massilia sp.]|nr:SCP2 sterol-binding domain-containing protein [Massilia sp.]